MKDYTRATRAEVERDIILMASDARVENVRRTAIQAMVRYNDLLPQSLTEAQFNSAVPNLVGLLTVAIPATPADFSTLTDAQAIALAQSHELATWDYQTRAEQVYQVEAFYQKLGFGGQTNASTNIGTIRATLLTFMNYARAARGLGALS